MVLYAFLLVVQFRGCLGFWFSQRMTLSSFSTSPRSPMVSRSVLDGSLVLRLKGSSNLTVLGNGGVACNCGMIRWTLRRMMVKTRKAT